MFGYGVSVVVAAYNVGPYIEECLESLVNQTLQELEILVIDDGSTDDTLIKVRRYESRFPSKVRVITQENRGIGRVRNVGIARVQGKYLGYVDGDDWVDREMYEALYVGAEEVQADQVICDGVLVEHTTRTQQPFYDRETWDRLCPAGSAVIDPAQCPDLFLLNASVCKRLYRMDLLRRLRYRFVERLLFEDVPPHYDLLCNSSRVLLVDRPFYKYRHGHPGRRTGRADRALIQVIEILFRVIKTLSEFHADPELWANFIRDQDWLLRWLVRQIDERFALDFARGACRVARSFPDAGIQRFRDKFGSDERTQTGVQLQLSGDEERYMEFVRGSDRAHRGASETLDRSSAAIASPSPTPRRARDCRVPILLYHSVADDGPDELAPYRVSCAGFREQMQLLVERGYHSVSLEDWARCIAAQRPLPGRPVIITFDDGYHDFYTNACPVLAETGLCATILVVTGRVGGVNDWDGDPGRQLKLMDWDELRATQLLGNTIGSHCVAHRELTKLSDEEIARDCAEARAALRAELGREATAVAFPWGVSDIRVRHLLAENGYRIAVGITGGLSTLSDDVMNLPRIEIFGDDDLDAFALKLDLDQHEIARPAAAPAPLPADDRPAAPLARLASELPHRGGMSFVLTIALSDTGRPGSDLARLRILLASFVKYFDMSTLAGFIVVTRPDDLGPVGEALADFGIPLLELVNEQDLCPELVRSPDTTSPWPTPNQGWHRQQLLKLACHERVRSDFYMTLDADVIFIRPFTASSLFRNGKALVNTQTAQDYGRLWRPEHAAWEIACRMQREQDAARILGMERRRADRFYGETPVVLSTSIVSELVQHLERRRGLGWRKYLLEQLPWTEYSLYFTFAEAVGLFDRHHVAGGFNAVLGMGDSLWAAPGRYLDGRSLSSWEIGREWSESVAIVVQSYLGYSSEEVAARAARLSIL